MKNNRIYRAVAIVAAAFLATGALAGCANPTGERPKFEALGPIGGDAIDDEGLEDEGKDEDEGDSSNIDTAAPAPEEMNLAGEISRCFTRDDVVDTSGDIHLVLKDCTESHDAEIFHVFDSVTAAWEEDAIESEAAQTCLPVFEAYIGTPALETSLDFFYFAPTEASWANGDRQVTCFIMEPSLLEGSAMGSAR